MKAILERKLDFLGLEGYSVDTEGNVWSSLNKEKELKNGIVVIMFMMS